MSAKIKNRENVVRCIESYLLDKSNFVKVDDIQWIIGPLNKQYKTILLYDYNLDLMGLGYY